MRNCSSSLEKAAINIVKLDYFRFARMACKCSEPGKQDLLVLLWAVSKLLQFLFCARFD
jgi:hypothetical protein